MLDCVENFLKKYEILNQNYTYLVGFSGGIDSLCLLDILNTICKKYDINLVAMHVNHNWRGEDAFREMKNCENFCIEKNIEFLSITLNADLKHSENVAREARQNFFIECANKYENPIIFTAHSATDNAETLLYRLVKGS